MPSLRSPSLLSYVFNPDVGEAMLMCSGRTMHRRNRNGPGKIGSRRCIDMSAPVFAWWYEEAVMHRREAMNGKPTNGMSAVHKREHTSSMPRCRRGAQTRVTRGASVREPPGFDLSGDGSPA